jgi:SAM-dependent methyltransferase
MNPDIEKNFVMGSRFLLNLLALAALVAAVLQAGCPKNDTGRTASGTEERALANSASPVEEPAPGESVAGSNQPPKSARAVPDPAHPPIDCPLRNKGIHSAHMRPFEEVEEYIAFLERPDRARWQKPDDVVAALALDGSETVFDLGAGSGYFAFRIARALPMGKVIAADTEAEMIRHIHHKAMTDGVGNIEARLIQPAAPEVARDADIVFVCDVLHHVRGRQPWLSAIATTMRSGATLVLIEFKEGDLPEGPPESVKIPRDRLVELVTGAGLVLVSERADLLPYQTFLVFRKP